MGKAEEIKVEITQVFNNNDFITLQPMRAGKEHGTAFEVQGKTFNKSFKHKTAKPEGNMELDKAMFQVKKKSNQSSLTK